MDRSPPILAKNLSFAYPPTVPAGQPNTVFHDLSFTVQPGECVALMGANGTGKTTLCRILTCLAPQMTGGQLDGRLEILGHPAEELRPVDLVGRVGTTFQEVEHQLFNATIESEVAWAMEALGMPPAEIEERIAWALGVVGLEVSRSHSPNELSGGQQRRLALAVALAPKPELLALDEPVGGLDPAGVRDLLAALAALRSETSAAILMAESNPEAVLALADRVLILHQGRVALSGPPREVLSQVAALRELNVAVPQLARLGARLSAKLGQSFSFLTVGEAERALADCRWADQPPSKGVAPAEPEFQPTSEDALRFEGVTFHYPEGPAVLQDIQLAVPAGQLVVLVGANGSGKTTLAKHTNGLLRPVQGRIWVGGLEAEGVPVGELARQVGYLFQHPERQIFASTVRDEVSFGPRNLGLAPAEVETRVAAALARFGLAEMASAPPAVMSYAQRRLITLASIAAMEPSILVLDEPTVGLDAPGWATTLAWVQELHAAGRTVLLVTHDMPAAAMAERMIVLDAGRVIADAPPAELFRRPQLLARAALTPPPVAQLATRLGLPEDVLDIERFVSQVAAN